MASFRAHCLALQLTGVLGLLLAAGCPETDEPTEEGTSDTSGTGDTSGTTAEVDETAGPDVDIPARGIVIRRVDVNSGVAITVAENGVLIAPQDRAPIPKQRNTALRVLVDVDEDVWVQREIEGRLTIVQPDGTQDVFSLSETIAADSSESNLQSNFLFGVTADLVLPDVAYRVELFETGTNYETLPEPELAPAVPETGTAYLGTQTSTQRMRVMLVPVQYTAPDGGACQSTTDTSEESLERYRAALFQHNPTESVEISVHEPMIVDDIDLSVTGSVYILLTRLSVLRADDAADPDLYYYALFDNCAACIQGDGSGGISGCLLGVAAGIAQATQGAGSIRVAVGVTATPSDANGGVDTFVHEIGHNQGGNHVACPGQTAAGPDVAYPHDNGSIGVWGFGVIDFAIRNPSNHSDYMSYCSPTWVSDYQWAATFDRIETLSGWGFGLDGGQTREEEPMLLVGAVNPVTGEQRWWTDRGTLAPADYSANAWEMAYTLDSGATVPVSAAVNPWSEGPWVSVRAPFGSEIATSLTALELVAPGRTMRLRASEIAGNTMADLRAVAPD
ncbi:MAG: hypothetical protein JKY37_16255 [Nannocystaceae bacterium]|nr:hypothetical protein [Nannocystaceae bacterium]